MSKKQFKAESRRLLDLMINSIYTNREIFLREIISNASDALDKLSYLALTDDKVGLNREDFAINITIDKDTGTLTVSDNGIGMTAEDLENNLGVIAKSGSKAFKEQLDKKDGSDVDIIGQFGVGFYSAFMVADKVTVISRAYGSEEANVWESEGVDGYTIKPAQRDGVGTDVILHIKPDDEEEHYSRFLEEDAISQLVTKYSDYIRFPIRMEVGHVKPVEKDGKTEYESVREVDTLNSMVPLWQKNKKDVTPEEYSAFYREKYADYEAPLRTIHFSAEGAASYTAMLFIPCHAPYDFYTKDYQKGLQLYSSGVLIMDKCADLLPDHFRFVKGVVDSQDFSLNISRELLQHDRQLKTIAANIEKKIKSELLKLQETDRENYEKFWAAFGSQIKYGLISDFGVNRELLRDLLLFYSSTENKLVTIKEYLSRMPEGQPYIYYATGASIEKIAQLPQTEKLKAKGYEVLYLPENVDEFVMQMLAKEGDKEYRSIVSDKDLGLETEEEKKAAETAVEENRDLLDFVKTALDGKVKDVRVATNLLSAPVCLSADGSISFELEKYFKSLKTPDPITAERVLELNLNHDAVKALKNTFSTDPEKASKYAKILYGQAVIAADLPLDDPTEYTELVCSLMK